MNINPVVLAIPFYFILIGIELLAEQFQRSKEYRLNDALTNISCGIGQQTVGVFLKIFTIGIFEWIRYNFAIAQIPVNWMSFVVLFILYDMAYYWAHRMSHEINLFWNGGHVVHHQSEDYNLSVALRQGWFQVIFTFPFSLPLAFAGFDTTQFLLVSGLNTVYQFWIHTEKIDKLGFLEWFMNTPSHHRVHHGRNPKYIDKNHAGVFIVWDRMFGTFQVEEERPVYGITTPTASWNPIWVQFKGLAGVWEHLQNTQGIGNKLKVLFYKPGWRTAEQGGYFSPPEVDRNHYTKFKTNVPNSVNWYVFLQYLMTLGGSAFFAFNQEKMDLGLKIVSALLVCWAILNAGGLFENRKWIYQLEYVRVFVTISIIGFLLSQTALFNNFLMIALPILMISLLWLWSFRDVFLKKMALQEA